MRGYVQETLQKKDVIRVKAKRYESSTSSETKTFSVDPELTTFPTLRELLIKAFNIKDQFLVSYLISGPGCNSPEDRYMPMLSEWDWNTAIYVASDPYLILKVDPKLKEMTTDLEEWNIIDEHDVAKLYEPCIPFGQAASENVITNKANRKSWYLDRYDQDENSSMNQSESIKRPSIHHPLTESDFKSYLDAEGRLLHSNAFRESVYRFGLRPSARHLVWPHLLNVYPDGMTENERSTYSKRLFEKYECLKESWLRRLRKGYIDEELRLVANAVRKDVIRTDRSHPYFSGDDNRNGNLMSLFCILTTYALAHPEVSYCQGMSDLASPLLTVLKDESMSYLCFCALMQRMRNNFSCDGWAMTRKFHHLSELVQYYDPIFYEYLREMHSEDLLFAYRWLLLELKREFAFDDALALMEIIWASLPPRPPEPGCDLDLYDVDLTDICDDESFAPAQIHDKNWSTTSNTNKDVRSGAGHDDAAGEMIDNQTENVSMRNPIMSTIHSCPGILSCSSGVCPALVVRSLMLNHKENKRLHALRHASYPPKPYARYSVDDGSLRPYEGKRNKAERFTIGCWTEDMRADFNFTPGNILESIFDDSSLSKSSFDDADDDNALPVNILDEEETVGTETIPTVAIDADVGESGGCKRNLSSDGHANGSKAKKYALRPSPELKVSDSADVANDMLDPQPVPIAVEAYVDIECNKVTNGDYQNELTLSRIHEICLANIPMDDSTIATSGMPSSKSSSACVSRRSREPSGNANKPQNGELGFGTKPGTTSLAFTTYDVSQCQTRPSSISYAPTTADSGVFEGVTATGSVELASRVSIAGSAEPQFNIDMSEFVNVDRDPTVSLPPPNELGDGNPFMLFVCLTIILQHREHMMRNQLDFNEIAVYFDKLMKKHDVNKILKRARILYADYLRTNSGSEHCQNIGISKAVAVSSAKYSER